MTIEDKLTTIGESLQDIKQAIINKGQAVTGNITTYADKINDIQSGVTPTGALSITANGVYDVTNYASTNVNVNTSNILVPGVTYTTKVKMNEYSIIIHRTNYNSVNYDSSTKTFHIYASDEIE